MKKNNKGFTLIESIISFAILAIAGGMFVLGFYNVSVIASEGSIIKTETNTLYNAVVAKEYSGEYSDSMDFTISGKTDLVSVKCATVSEEKKLESGTNEYKIVLSKFMPFHSLNEWVDSDSMNEETVQTTIRFYLRWPMATLQNSFPVNIQVPLNQNSDGGVVYKHITYDNVEINKNTTTNYYNEQYILNNINKFPDKTEVSTVMGGQYTGREIIWYQVIKNNDLSYDVVGYEIASGTYQNRTVLLDKDGSILFDAQNGTWSYTTLQSAFSKSGNVNAKAICIRDGVAYSSTEIYDKRIHGNTINIYQIQ